MIVARGFEGKTVGVLGLARSGAAAVKSLEAGGATVFAWDDSEKTRAKYPFRYRNFSEDGVGGLDAISFSPGIPHTFPAPHPVAAMAKAAGVEIISDIEIFARTAPTLPAHTIIGITGTNGKSTTTALTAHLLKAAGRDTAMGGNIGVPVLDLDPVAAGGTYVFELSSYQLDIIQSLHVDAAVLLNITPDHLDRHGGFEGYVLAKKRLFDMQRMNQTAIIGVDDASGERMAGTFCGRVVPVSVKDRLAQGISVVDGQILENNSPVADLHGIKTLNGRHNWQNAACAWAAVRAVGLSVEQAAAGLASFPGLAHRQEWVAEINGVAFINDSKATNNDAAATALAAYETIHWIAGGRPKTPELDDLAEYFPRIAHAYLIGEAAAPFAENLKGQVPATICGTLDVAVRKAYEGARGSGGVVLFSPACASFDQFTDFEARGDAFRAEVASLKGEG